MADGRRAVPERLRRAVEVLQIAPDDEVLEIGCGPGVAVELVCERLVDGHITAIDRSAIAIERAARRNAAAVATGRAVLLHRDLVGLSLPVRAFDTAFAVDVNHFWTHAAAAEVAELRRALRPGGVLHLGYDAPGHRQAGRAVEAVAAALTAGGFPTVTTSTAPGLVVVSGRTTTGAPLR